MKRVVVVGGGLAGLCAALAVRRADRSLCVTMLEGSQRFGGWLHSERVEGLLFERGCRGIRPSGSGGAALALVESLGLSPQALPSSPSATRRYVQYRGALHALPSGLVPALRSPLTRGALAWGLRDLSCALKGLGRGGGDEEDESVAAFAERHFGEHVARVLLDAALGGIYAGNIDALSARSVLAPLWRAEEAGGGSVLVGFLREWWAARGQRQAQQQGSPFVRSLAATSSVSFVNGLGSLIAALVRELEKDPGVELLSGQRVSCITMRGTGGAAEVSAECAFGAPRGKPLAADALILALPAPALARLLRASSSATGDLGPAAAAAEQVPMASVGVVGLGWRHDPGLAGCTPFPALPHCGFGYLTPAVSRATSGCGIPLLGMTWDSDVFPGQEAAFAEAVLQGRGVGRDAPASKLETRVTVMLGGARDPRGGQWGEEELQEAALAAARHPSVRVGLGTPPAVVSASIAKDAIPQYTIGHSGRVAAVEAGVWGAFGGQGRVALVGNSWRGVGAADTIKGALEAGEAVAGKLKSSGGGRGELCK